jgi:hypothetical protein
VRNVSVAMLFVAQGCRRLGQFDGVRRGLSCAFNRSHDSPCNHLQLRGHHELVTAFHLWHTSASELLCSTNGQNSKFEGADLAWDSLNIACVSIK